MPASNNNRISTKICVLFLLLLVILGLLVTGGFFPDEWIIKLTKSGWGLASLVFLILIAIAVSVYPITFSKDTDDQE